jgi:hypothetical protein
MVVVFIIVFGSLSYIVTTVLRITKPYTASYTRNSIVVL